MEHDTDAGELLGDDVSSGFPYPIGDITGDGLEDIAIVVPAPQRGVEKTASRIVIGSHSR